MWDYESIEQVVVKEIKDEALKKIRKTPEYKNWWSKLKQKH